MEVKTNNGSMYLVGDKIAICRLRNIRTEIVLIVEVKLAVIKNVSRVKSK